MDQSLAGAQRMLDQLARFLAELGTQGMLLLSGGFAGLSLALVIMAIYILYRGVPKESRDYMDPLPRSLRLVWPLIQCLAYYVCTNFPIAALERTEDRLQKTGVGYLLNAEQFLAVRILSTLVAPLLAVWALAVSKAQGPWIGWIALATIVGFLLPQIWLNDTRKRREIAVIRAMPVYLDFVTMAVEAGLNLAGALAQAMQKGPKGALRNELAIVLRDLRSGVTRADALKRMSARLDIKDVTSFVNAVIQAERMGASLASVLRVQSEQRRNERFLRAEKAAMQAPVKLLLPLILFIFPVTFLVLAFPIVMKFLHGGIL